VLIQHCKLYLLGKVLSLGIGAVSNSLRCRADLLSHILNALVDLQGNNKRWTRPSLLPA
jgi:hypothetical protein